MLQSRATATLEDTTPVRDEIPLIERGDSTVDVAVTTPTTPVRRAPATLTGSPHFKPALITALVVLTVGVLLAIPGAVLLFSDEVDDPPFLWSVPLCTTGNGTWYGTSSNRTECSLPPAPFSYSFVIPGRYIDLETPYRPFLMLSDKGTRSFRCTHSLSFSVCVRARPWRVADARWL